MPFAPARVLAVEQQGARALTGLALRADQAPIKLRSAAAHQCARSDCACAFDEIGTVSGAL